MQRQSRERIGGTDGTDLRMAYMSFVDKFSLECSLKITETNNNNNNNSHIYTNAP